MGGTESKEIPEEDTQEKSQGTGTEATLDEDEEFMDAEDDSLDSEEAYVDRTSTGTFLTASTVSSVYHPPSEVPASLCVNYFGDNKSCFQGQEGQGPPDPPISIADMRDFECSESSNHSGGTDISLSNGTSVHGEDSEDEHHGFKTTWSESSGPGGDGDGTTTTTPDEDTHLTDFPQPTSGPGSPMGPDEVQSLPSGNNLNQREPRRETGREIPFPAHVKLTEGPFGPIYQCICGKAFSSKENVNYHKNCDGSRKEFQCPECPKTFSLRSHSLVHIRDVHRRPRLQCSVCHKMFHRKSRLSAHLKGHSGVRPYGCSDCELSFTSKEILQNHTRHIHIPGEPAKCSLCDKTFKNNKNLKMHQKTHSEVSFPCSTCGRVFRHRDTLQHHMTTFHAPTETEPPLFKFQCSSKECGKIFASKNRLESHESQTHSEDGGVLKSFSCKSCPSTFTRRDNLRRHVRMVHVPPIQHPPKPTGIQEPKS